MKQFLLLLLSLAACDVNALPQRLRIIGQTNDVRSGASVAGVSFYIEKENRRTLLSSTNEQGRFSLDLLSDATKLIIEKKGYRLISTGITTYRNKGNKVDFFVKIPLIPLDAQANDTPYMQSQQTQYTVENEQRKKTAIVRKFFVSDAISGSPVRNGTLCFEFTRNAKRECKQLSEETVMSFGESDIVGFTVSAEGYQEYTGNLILDKIDEKAGTYDIKLTPEITMLSLNISGNSMVASCKLTADSGNEIVLSPLDKMAYSALVHAGNYRLTVFDRKMALIHSEQVSVVKGLNFIGLVVGNRPVSVPETTVKKTETESVKAKGLDSLETLTIYFNQSDYTFKSDEKAKLDALAAWLKQHLNKKVRVVGHTDNVGSSKLNITLSEFRAKVIRHYLLSRKVSENQILWAGVGGKYPARKNDTEENKRLNRRVEISMLP
ncbi:OmpA family protein [Dyadobacter aurulentus]|uniref:OmpA family protein n=1 Tax=Dyadobacter sp. UC 10 TaxID=2605428 RepID=UPI0011F1F026|nr:OmpA family protein [Dyadobacter sp. UC 10]KAA0989245.1 OmpA family protein [Dyadobacter sp. UC 10]